MFYQFPPDTINEYGKCYIYEESCIPDTQLTFTYSESTIKTLAKRVKYVQN